MQKKNILIINYVFPPYPGIGGRRWAKFAKYLHRNGHQVFVIGAQNPFSYVSTFINDIKELPKENLYYLPALYPKSMISPIHSLADKYRYQFWYRVLPFFTKGNYYDRTIFWKRQVQEKAKELIHTKKIHTVIISSPPFHYAYHVLQLKDKYPFVKFIVDYRDEWTFNNIHGYAIIGKARQAYEQYLEKYVCEKADYILSPAEDIINQYLKQRYPLLSKKMILLNHSFDKDDFPDTGMTHKNSSISFAYAGTMYAAESFFQNIHLFLDRLSEKYPLIFNKVDIKFYTIGEFVYPDILQKYSDKLQINYNVPANRLFQELKTVHYLFIFYNERAKNYFTTKFAEYLYLQKPLLYYGPEGKVSEYITTHKLGIHLKDGLFAEQLIHLLENKHTFEFSDELINSWDIIHNIRKIEQLLS